MHDSHDHDHTHDHTHDLDNEQENMDQTGLFMERGKPKKKR